jgi:FkbM family methyltransferase
MMNIKVYAQTPSKNTDVTCIVENLFFFVNMNQIIVPGDNFIKKKYFGQDQINKFIVKLDSKNYDFDVNDEIIIDLQNRVAYKFDYNYIINELYKIHDKITFYFGSLKNELPEQMMVKRFLSSNRKVLEIGGNIGRNSMIISFILSLDNNDGNLVVLESDSDTAGQLRMNRDANNFRFHVEASALSKSKLIQKGWDCFENNSDFIPEGYKWVNTITYNQLKYKYNINFDTLVLDCEGSFYQILIDFPEILKNITLIIIENDFNDKNKKKYVDSVLEKNNFVLVHNSPLTSIDYFKENAECFFQVWKLNSKYKNNSIEI